MADNERLRDAAAFASQQRRRADEIRQRADALRDDADYRRRSAAEHRTEIEMRLRRGIHRDGRPLTDEDRII